MWELISQSDITDRHWAAWQSLNERYYRSHPLLDPKFMRPLVDCFSENGLFLALETSGDEVSMAILLENPKFGRWQVFSPSQSSIAPMLADPEMEKPKMLDHLRSLSRALPGPVWLIAFLKLDPDFLDLENLLENDLTERIWFSRTINIDLTGDFDDYWSDRGKKHRQNIRKRLKLLEQRGITSRFRVITEVEGVDDAICTHGELESSGWKGQLGTAIRTNNIQGTFYTAILKNFAASGGAYACQLIADDQPIASLINIHQNGIIISLKTAYLESMAEYSPGRLIDYFLLPRLFAEESIRLMEHYTNASPTDEKWATGTREIYHLNFFPNRVCKTLVRLLRLPGQVKTRLHNWKSAKQPD